MAKLIDLTDQKFGLLTAISYDKETRTWLCKCQCGNETKVASHNLRNGQFFSNLKNVATGDIIKITDTSGQTLTYTIYEKYETTPERKCCLFAGLRSWHYDLFFI